mgnify:CR=1 FL=1
MVRIKITEVQNSITIPYYAATLNLVFVHAMSGQEVSMEIANTESAKFFTGVIDGTLFTYKGQYSLSAQESGQEVYKTTAKVYTDDINYVTYHTNNQQDNVIYQ